MPKIPFARQCRIWTLQETLNELGTEYIRIEQSEPTQTAHDAARVVAVTDAIESIMMLEDSYMDFDETNAGMERQLP